MRRWRSEPGRLKIKLAEILQAAGFRLTEYDIREARGYYRSSPYSETYRWEAYALMGTAKIAGYEAQTPPETFQILLASWDTMTACVRQGIRLDYEGWDDVNILVTVSAKSCAPKS